MLCRLLLIALMTVGLTFAADLTGTWNLTVDTDAGSGNPTLTLKQSGDQLTGTYSGLLGDEKLTGTVKGDQVEITFTGSYSGEQVKVVYRGKLEGSDLVKGTVEYGSLGNGTWTGTRKK